MASALGKRRLRSIRSHVSRQLDMRATADKLKPLAEATGGQWFDASDAAKIDLVFASVINNF